MKLLLTYANSVSYTPRVKNLETAPDVSEGAEYQDIIVAFIHIEEKDTEDFKSSENKLVKNLKWIARKNDTKKILLHSFAHLSESKAPADFTKQLLDKVHQRLQNAGYEVYQSPFGYFLDFKIDWPGRSLARVFKSL